VAVIVGVFVVLQATNNATVSVMTLFVSKTLGLDVTWAGLALGVAAALEIPALLLIGRLNRRFSNLALIAAGCLAGIAFYAGMAAVSGPILLLALQLLNAGFFVVAGVGLALFQEIIPRPGLASGLYTNTRRLGAIVSGPIIALGSLTIGYRAVFAACAVLTALALLVVAVLGRVISRSGAAEQGQVRSERPDPSLG
jgi:SET family sugar efflux transporter-like MFS transporter